MSAQSKLNEVLVRWDAEVRNFAEATTADAKASVEWEYFAAAERAKIRDAALAAGDKLTVKDLDDRVLIADTDKLHLTAELAAAAVTASRKALDLWEARADAARSEVSTERASNQHWAAAPAPAWREPSEW